MSTILKDGETIFPAELLALASAALDAAKKKNIRLAAAETVTAGLVSACLTSVSGASQIFDRGYVLYHESAKATGLGVAEEVSAQHGAVSAEVTQGLAEGLLSNSGAAVDHRRHRLCRSGWRQRQKPGRNHLYRGRAQGACRFCQSAMYFPVAVIMSGWKRWPPPSACCTDKSTHAYRSFC